MAESQMNVIVEKGHYLERIVSKQIWEKYVRSNRFDPKEVKRAP